MGALLASIHAFPTSHRVLQFSDRSFDAESTALICQAFDKASRALNDRGQPDSVKEIIARRIIEIAARGERDPDRMSQGALTSLTCGETWNGASFLKL
jgi:hypothetical protein